MKPHTGKYTGQALALTKEGLFDTGRWPDALDVVLLMTDGPSSDEVSGPSRLLRDMGVKVKVKGAVVGIGEESEIWDRHSHEMYFVHSNIGII